MTIISKMPESEPFMENDMAKAKNKLIETEIEQTITIDSSEGTIAVTQPEQVSTTNGIEKYLIELANEANKLDSVSAMVQSIMVKNRIITIINKIRAEL